MNKKIQVVMNYLSQASTYKGIFAIFAAFGVVFKPELADAIIACALGITGLINVVIDDSSTKQGDTI